MSNLSSMLARDRPERLPPTMITLKPIVRDERMLHLQTKETEVEEERSVCPFSGIQFKNRSKTERLLNRLDARWPVR